MGGMDLGEQLRKYYSVRLKCRKNKIIYFLVYFLCMYHKLIYSQFCNSTSQPTKEDSRLKTFRAHLAESLIGSYTSRQRADRPRSQGVVEPSPVEQHFTPLVTTTVSGAYTATKLGTPPAGEKVCGCANYARENRHYASRAERTAQTAGLYGTRFRPRTKNMSSSWSSISLYFYLCQLSLVYYIQSCRFSATCK